MVSGQRDANRQPAGRNDGSVAGTAGGVSVGDSSVCFSFPSSGCLQLPGNHRADSGHGAGGTRKF